MQKYIGKLNQEGEKKMFFYKSSTLSLPFFFFFFSARLLDNVDIFGYVAKSFMDGFEWDLGYSVR